MESLSRLAQIPGTRHSKLRLHLKMSSKKMAIVWKSINPMKKKRAIKKN